LRIVLYACKFIRKGTLVCTYTGEIRLSEVELHSGNEYTMRAEMDWEYPKRKQYSSLLIDAKLKGNVSRFITTHATIRT